jgi:hypothetical protein
MEIAISDAGRHHLRWLIAISGFGNHYRDLKTLFPALK